MTNMTRRNFLKSAGVMALAVAAAGVLSGCDSSSKNPVMADVKVEYWREKNNWLQDLHIGDGAYDETVSVVKSGKVKKEQLQKLGKVMVNTGYKLSDSTATEFDVDWTQEPPVAKVWMKL
ncbi:MAG: twin-arginine translocation signal domain-containing protein [Faecalibacterium prausnitzii]|nr:twin-arginine translocation signal domain-containing protein [Faecalibacterium prausnitzii]